jgi:hypothetical protein
MGSLKQLSQRLRNLKESGLNSILSTNLNNKERFIVDLNQDQLLDGQRADGGLMPKYKGRKINRKGGNTFDLYQEGDLHSRMFAQADKDKLLIGSNDWKASIYDEKDDSYHPFGLQDKNKVLLKDSMRSTIGNQIIKHLKGK